MDAGIALALFSALREDEQAFIFSGTFHDDHTARLIPLGEAVQRERWGGAVSGRLAFLMVEAYQNVIRHQAPIPTALARSAGRNLFMLRARQQGCDVATVNPILEAARPRLDEALLRLRDAETAELKRMFLDGLRTQHDGKRRGAGLGFIEMARRSGNALRHQVRPLDADSSLFTLAIGTGEYQDEQDMLALVNRMHDLAVDGDLLLAYVGVAAVDVQAALLRMLEHDVDPARGKELERAYLAAGTWLLSAAGKEARGVLAIVRAKDHLHVMAGAVMDQDSAEELRDQVQQVNAIDRSEVDRHYRRLLLDPARKEGSADLFDMARITLEPLVVEFHPSQGKALCLVSLVL